MSVEALQTLVALGLGFAVAGMLASLYQALVERPASFHALTAGGASAYAHVPFLVFAAPFIIMRNTVRGRRIEGRSVVSVALATMFASFWSLMSGTAVVAGLRALGLV